MLSQHGMIWLPAEKVEVAPLLFHFVLKNTEVQKFSKELALLWNIATEMFLENALRLSGKSSSYLICENRFVKTGITLGLTLPVGVLFLKLGSETSELSYAGINYK